MLLIDLCKQILFSLWSHKIRTSLALFGIGWGTVTIIILLALGNGFYDASMKNLSFLNNGTIFTWPGVTSKPYAGLPQGQKLHLKEKDFLDIAEHIPNLKSFTPMYSTLATFEYQNKQLNATLQGVGASFGEIQQFSYPANHRFINPLDIQKQHRVVYLDATLKKSLFGEQDAIGNMLMINSIPFLVIGVNHAEDEAVVRLKWTDDNAYIPYSIYSAIFGPKDLKMIFLTPLFLDEVIRIKQHLKTMLAMKLHFDPTDDEAFHIPDLEAPQIFFSWFFRVVQLFLAFSGILTLSVGGLGTANMMFLIVTERTREIGLRMALGAGYSEIMLQFMLETGLLIGLGGILGAILAGIVLSILQHIGLPAWLGNPHVSGVTVSLTIIALSLVGLLAGYYPARRAANMEPVKALGF